MGQQGISALEAFVAGPLDVPGPVRRRLAWLLQDFLAVSIAGRAVPAARLSADHAASVHPGDAATALFDGRRLATAGAAWANGVLADALDFDDGHRLVKGHPGAVVIPAALAIAEHTDASFEEFLTAVAVGYEVALRAGMSLHARSSTYHASGAWGALGAAAAAARLLGLGGDQTRHALGLAEYHAPMAPIMRSVAEPAMTKDAIGWGAMVGVSCALLAGRGFTATPHGLGADDLGQRWHLLDVYVKAFPCCRWSQPAVQAALTLRSQQRWRPEDLRRVVIRTFAPAAALAGRAPRTTEQAQYSLVWPVAVALVHGRFGVGDVLAPGLDDAEARHLLENVEVVVDPAADAAFPGRRSSEVAVETAAGRWFESGPHEAPGEPGDPGWTQVVSEKFRRFAAPLLAGADAAPARSLGGLDLDGLLRLVSTAASGERQEKNPSSASATAPGSSSMQK